jgi:hypothetical protein
LTGERAAASPRCYARTYGRSARGRTVPCQRPSRSTTRRISTRCARLSRRPLRSQPYPSAVPQLLHRVAEAAAAFGRVDILNWLHSQHDVFTSQPLLLSFCVKHATRHGQITVLEWMEQTFSSHALEILRDYVVHALVQQRDSKMVQWLCTHKLGVVPARSLRFAAERGDVDTLRVLLDDGVVHAPHRETLVALAVRAGQADVVAYLVGDRAFPFTTTTLDKAIAQRQLAVAKCLLDHRESLRRSERATLVSSSLVQQLIASNDLAMLSMLASMKNATVLGCTVMTCCHFARPSDAAVRVLLPLSSAEDATVTLLRFAVRKQASIVDTILAGTRAPLPAVAVAFVTRIANDSLGPLATRAMEFYESRESSLMDEIVASVSKASREDVVDTVLRFLPGPAFSLTSILKADAKRPGGAACDEPFLQLCLSLRQSERDSHHRAIQQYLHTRKKPRAASSVK